MYLYIGSNSFVSAIDPKSGREVWRTTLAQGLLGGSAGQDVCILEDQGRVYAGCYGKIYALDGANGNLLWQNDLKGMGYNDVTLAMAGKCIQYVATDRHHHTHS